MSNVPAPLPDFNESVPAANAAAQDNPQGSAAEPAKAPGGPAAKQPDAQEPLAPMPKLKPGAPQPVPPLQGHDALLFGPTSRPFEPISRGAGVYAKPQPPENLGKYVPALRAATTDPEAPPLLHNIYQLLAYHLGE